jgi:hypothetical protein
VRATLNDHRNKSSTKNQDSKQKSRPGGDEIKGNEAGYMTREQIFHRTRNKTKNKHTPWREKIEDPGANRCQNTQAKNTAQICIKTRMGKIGQHTTGINARFFIKNQGRSIQPRRSSPFLPHLIGN